MEELQQSRNNSAATFHRGLGRFLKVCSWGWGLWGIMAGIVFISRTPVLGSVLAVLGILMLPPVRKLIGNAMKIRLAQPAAGGIGVAIFVFTVLAGARIQADEERRQEQMAEIELEEKRQDSMFIARHPFVDRASLSAWRVRASDSTTDSTYRLAAFLGQQEELYKKRIADSIEAAKQHRVDSIAAALRWRSDSIQEAREARRLAREQANLYQSSSPAVSVEYDIDIEPSRSKRSRSSRSGSRKSYSSGSYSSGSSYSGGSRSYGGGGGRRGGRRR